MTAAEKAQAKIDKVQTPEMAEQIEQIRAEIVRRQAEDSTREVESAVARFSQAKDGDNTETPAETKAMTLWRKVIPLDDDAGIWRWVMIEVLTLAREDVLKTYCHGYNTCLVESFHARRAAHASKRIHWKRTWAARCALIGLQNNLGHSCILPVMRELGLKLSLEQKEQICREETQRVSMANRRNGEEVRLRLLRREKTRKVHRVRTLIEGTDLPKVVNMIPRQRGKHLPYILPGNAGGGEEAEGSVGDEDEGDESSDAE
jgi:hypothetical protein